MPAPVTTTLLLVALIVATLGGLGASVVVGLFVTLALLNEAYVFYLLGRVTEDDDEQQ